jgi:hypothetical protein
MEGRLPSPSETRQCQTASYFHRLSLSLILLMQTSHRVASKKKNNASNPGNYSIVPFSTQNLFPQALQYVSAPTSWSTCTHLHSCQSLRPKPPGPNQPSIPEPRDSSHTHVPYIHISLLPSTFYTLNSLPPLSCHHLPASPSAHASRPSPPSQPQPRTQFPTPHSSTHKSLGCHATTKSSQAKSSQFNVKANQISPGNTLPSPHRHDPPIIT